MIESVFFQGMSAIEFKNMIAQVVGDEVEKRFQLLVLQTKDQTKEHLTAKETASTLGVSLQTLNNWVRSGYLVPSKVNTRVRYKYSDVAELLNRKQMRAA